LRVRLSLWFCQFRRSRRRSVDILELLGHAIGTEGEGRDAKHRHRQVQPPYAIAGRDP